jgi:hypothetical protein
MPEPTAVGKGPRGPKPNFERIKTVVTMRRNGFTFSKIGESLGVSHQRAAKIYWTAINLWKERVLALGVNPNWLKKKPKLRRYTLCIACGEQVKAILGEAEAEAPASPPEEAKEG